MSLPHPCPPSRTFEPAGSLAVVSLLALALAGCAGSNPRYPSLLPRAAESRSAAEPVAVAAALVADPALDISLGKLDGELKQAAAAFAPLATKATRLTDAAVGAGIGSDAWLAAQSALADMDALRAQSISALSEIDRVAIERGVAGLPAYPALEVLRDAAEAQATAQTATIEALQVKLPTL